MFAGQIRGGSIGAGQVSTSRLDDLRIYDRVLSDTDIAGLVGQTSAANEALPCVPETTCNPGEYTSTDGTCLACPEGTYSDDGTVTQCTSCTQGQTTASTGSTGSSDCVCDVGYFLNGATCTPCLEDKYKSTVGNAACIDCPAGSTTDGQTGRDSAADCKSYGVPGDVAKYRIRRADDSSQAVQFSVL